MTGHDYGPHRPEDQRQTVGVYPAGKWTELEEVPIHPALLRQWEHVNRLAHERVEGQRGRPAGEQMTTAAPDGAALSEEVGA